MSSQKGNNRSLLEGNYRAIYWPYLLLAALVILFFNQMVFTDLILARGDTFLYFYPYWQLAADALRAGELPFWNPHIFMGAPLLANSQVGFFYPPNWLFWLTADPPQAVKMAIVSHLIVGAWGMFRLAFKRFEMSVPAALLSAIVFALGGYLTAQVEHVNQLEGLVWLPWLLLALSKPSLRRLFPIAILFTLQILAGHTQTVFLSGVACGLWLVVDLLRSDQSKQAGQTWRQRLPPLGILAVGAVLALLLAAVQLIPTYELTQLSSRQGGLTTAEVLSFSWHPLLASQSLLPTLGQSGFTEYVAFIPLVALFLACWAVVITVCDGWKKLLTHELAQPLMLVLIGLFLALGRFNFVSWFYSSLPGFDLFRVPARWLILYAVGIALLAGLGLDRMGVGKRNKMIWGFLAYGFLLLWSPISVRLAQFVPIGAEAALERLSSFSLLLLTAELLLFLLIWLWIYEREKQAKPYQSIAKWLMVGLASLSLYAASRDLPYNRLTTAEAYTDLRPAGLRLQADAHSQIVPDRFISLSDIFFDPGDQAEIDTIYADRLSDQALYDYTVSIKLKEIISPNFPMVYGLASLDGFDGGILPLKSYSTLMSQTILPDGRVTTDGRLREHLDTIPAAEWLDKFNVRYVITDKVGDVWVNDVFFDRQHVVPLAPNQSVQVGYLPDFLSDEIHLLAEQPLGLIQIESAAGMSLIQPEESADTPGLWVAKLENAVVLQSVEIFAAAVPVELTAVSLVNAEEGWFKSVTAEDYRLVHSGDVKIYENLDVWPRAILLESGSKTLAQSVRVMGDVEFLSYAPERIELKAEPTQPSTLVLTDATYPGWTAYVDGSKAELVTIDGFLRGVELDAGEHEIRFEFRPDSFRTGLTISILTLIGFVAVFIWLAMAGYLAAKGK